MEFEEMKKIWDSQNNEALYAINEQAMQKQIRAKSKAASQKSNVVEIGLILIMVVTSGILLFFGSNTMYAYMSSAAMLGIAGYVFYGRIGRKRMEAQFDRTMLGELDQAISNVNNELNRAKNFVWWMLVPAGIPIVIRMIMGDMPAWKFVVIPLSFALAYFVTRWELRRCHIPRKKRLEILRENLLGETREV